MNLYVVSIALSTLANFHSTILLYLFSPVNANLNGAIVYSISIHLVLATKYRRKVITIARLTRLEEIFKQTCEKWECELKEFKGEPDHVDLLIDINPKVQISTLANNLKTVSSRLIRKEFSKECAKYYGKPVVWKIGDFVASTGGANIETIKKYIQGQDSDKCE